MNTKLKSATLPGTFFVCPLLLLLCLICPASVKSAPAVPEGSFVGVCSAIVYDMDQDAILFEQNADQPIPPASLTKILSMFLARDFIREGHAKMDTLVPVSREAAYAGGSSMGLKPGEEVPFQNLLMGMAVSSGNDASHAIAEYVGGSVNSFVKMMNVKAAQLGMLDSHFYNPHGLPAEGQQTTARDMLALARAYLQAYPDALEFHNTRTLTHRGYTSWNKNPLLGQYPGADGLKSGWIRASGYNLVFTATRGNRRLLAVILGAPDSGTRGAEACRLLDAGFMVCGNLAVSVAAALDQIPYDDTRIDPKRTAREAGILKSRIQPVRLATNSRAKKSARLSERDVKKTEKSRRSSRSLAAKKDSAKIAARGKSKTRQLAVNHTSKRQTSKETRNSGKDSKSRKAASNNLSGQNSRAKKGEHAARKLQKGRAHKG